MTKSELRDRVIKMLVSKALENGVTQEEADEFANDMMQWRNWMTDSELAEVIGAEAVPTFRKLTDLL